MNILKPFIQLPLPGWCGLALVTLLAGVAMWITRLPLMQELRFSPLVVAIVLGVILGNTVYHTIPSSWLAGVRLAQQKILRLGIILYGLQITLQDIVAVGIGGLFIDIFIVASVFLLGTWAGVRWLKLDRDTAMLTAGGSAICGAAAVLAMEPVLRAENYKVTVAVATVVLFGTLSMFLYPFLFYMMEIDAHTFGIYIGATVHEVAQVVAAGEAVSAETATTAVIVKLTRVMLLAPFLFLLAFYMVRCPASSSRHTGAHPTKILIPWFAIGFVGVSILNSFDILPEAAVASLIRLDIFLLAMAMAALGIESNIHKFKGVGFRPVILAGGLFVYLLVMGYVLIRYI